MSIKVIPEPAPAPGNLKKKELFAISIGQVIGAGVITLIVPAIKMTGYSAWLAYFVAIIMGFFIILPAVFITSTLRLGGGYYSVLCDLAGPRWSGMFAYAYLTQCVSLSLFGVAAAEYIGDVIPAMSSPVCKMCIGSFLLTFFYIVNLMGINFMAKAQKLMTWILIAALVMFSLFGIAKIKLPIFDIHNSGFMPNGWIQFSSKGALGGGFLSAVMLFVYSCQGYFMTMAYGRDAANAKRDIPFAIIVSAPTLVILYCGVAIAATGSFSIQDYGKSISLVFAAAALMPKAIFYLFIIGGPIMALLSTLNSTYAYNSITIAQSCTDGWLPQKIGKRNRFGSSKYILTFMYLIGLIPILLRFNVITITNQIQLVMAILNFLYLYACLKMPKKYSEAWNKSRFHVPDNIYYFFVGFSFMLNLIILWKSTLSMSHSIVIVSIIAIVVCLVLGLLRACKGTVEIHTSVWPD